MIDATPPFVFLPGARFPFLRPSRGLRAVTCPSALPLLLYVSSGAALFDSPLEYVHAERCRENQVTGRGVARLTREIEIIEQSRRLDDIYSHEFREEVVARLENLHFPIDCRDHRRDSLLPRYSLSRYYSSSSFSLRWISLFILLIIAFFNSSSVLSRRLFGDRDGIAIIKFRRGCDTFSTNRVSCCLFSRIRMASNYFSCILSPRSCDRIYRIRGEIFPSF